MLIIPPGHFQEVRSGRKLAPREKWLIRSGVVLLAVIVIAVGIALTSRQKTSHHGCIDVSAATVIGGSELYRCGSAARGLCTSATGTGDANVSFRIALANACRKAGLPVPRVPAHS